MEAIRIDAQPRRLGRSDISVFPIAYGCWRFAGTDVATATGKVEAALEAGNPYAVIFLDMRTCSTTPTSTAVTALRKRSSGTSSPHTRDCARA